MTFQFHKLHRGRPEDFLYFFYNFEAWEIEYTWPSDLDQAIMQELQRDDVWSPTFFEQRHYYSGSNAAFHELYQGLAQQKNTILDHMNEYQPKYFRSRWVRGLDYYKENSRMLVSAYRDQPGFSIDSHLDNQHIIVQAIINLTNNDVGTEYQTAYNRDTVYTAPTNKHWGSMFVNGPGAVHSIKNGPNTRFILYATIEFG